MRTAILQSNETKIEKKRLAELERKERAHDAYMRATARMRDRQAEVQSVRKGYLSAATAHYDAGWLECLREFSELVVREDA